MKNKVTILLICILSAVIFSACGAGKNAEEEIQTKVIEKVFFEAIVLEVNEKSILVEPTEGKAERKTADLIRLHTYTVSDEKSLKTLSQIVVNDIVEIGYSGEISESYPAQIAEVSEIKLVSEPEVMYDKIPMVMVEGKLYYITGKESSINGRCGTMDGTITSTVDGTEIPTEDGQSNFGTGCGYQYGLENTIEVNMDNKWIVFEYRGDENTKTVEDSINEVVIEAHIKEIIGSTMVISSDSDEYPGAFFIDVPKSVDDMSDYEAGDLIIIHMTDKNSEKQGMKEFQASSILPREE